MYGLRQTGNQNAHSESDIGSEVSPLVQNMYDNTTSGMAHHATSDPATTQGPDPCQGATRMLQFWLFGLFFPIGLFAWCLTHKIILVVLAILLLPFIALLQGSAAILRYRLKYGDCPIPMAPSHGMVKVTSTYTPHQTMQDESLAPLRLLVIGDSLAAGVGQCQNATPVLPEVMAKSLSRQLGGRPVLWTCHGEPGASAGWIVREFQQSVQRGSFLPAETSLHKHKRGHTSKNCDGESSAQESSWKESLEQEQVDLDPQTSVGPFDIVVVFTGSNDLKSAFFPFLLTGEDSEFRREAQQRGGGYGEELMRVLNVLDQSLRRRLQTLRHSVKAASQRVRERLGSFDTGIERSSQTSSDAITPREQPCESTSQDDTESPSPVSPNNDATVPLIVLPGMPARTLPVFSMAPLRWLTVPIVDVMDSHKRKLASQHKGEVMFVDSPSVEQLTEYVNGEGPCRTESQGEHVQFQIRDIEPAHAEKIEHDMFTYFESSNKSKQTRQRNQHYDAFAVDGIHPNDQGYEFWGRYIAQHIAAQWSDKKQ
eukprot:Nitzschia sp. Nitz4//scaffold3_size479765//131430//133046//NITZ4_000057-RA/size479765-processed-gene-0.99-mRNA-1//-1//CDS//3329550629//7754//frame0